MGYKEKITKYLHRIYRTSEYLNDFISALEKLLDNIESEITRLENLLHFNRLDEKSCIWWEKLLDISDASNNLETRRSKIRAKFLSNTHNDIKLLQRICDSWKNGETRVEYIAGKIQIKFVGEYGIPEDLTSLLHSVEEVKPCHLPYYLEYKYLLIEDIHEVKTLEELETIPLNMFAFGIEGEI